MRRVAAAAIVTTPLVIIVVSLFALLTIPDVMTQTCTTAHSNSAWLILIIIGLVVSIITGIIVAEELG